MSLLQKVKNGMRSPDWHVSIFDIHLRKKSYGCTVLDMPESKEMTEQIDRPAGKATITDGLRLGRSEVSRSLRHYLRAQSQEHHTIDRMEEREA